MNSYDVAKWLNTECTDDEFVETFTYLYLMMNGRKVDKQLNKNLVHEMWQNSDRLFNQIEVILTEIIPNQSKYKEE